MTSKKPLSSDTRSLSDVLGYAIIFSIILLSITLVSLVGFQNIDDARESQTNSQIQNSYSQLDSNIELVLDETAQKTRTTVSVDNSLLYLGEEETFTIVNDGNDVIRSDVNPIVYDYNRNRYKHIGTAAISGRTDGGFIFTKKPRFLQSGSSLLFRFPEIQPSNSTSEGFTVSQGNWDIVLESDDNATEYRKINNLQDPKLEIETPNTDLWESYCNTSSYLSFSNIDSGVVNCSIDSSSVGSISVSKPTIRVSFE